MYSLSKFDLFPVLPKIKNQLMDQSILAFLMEGKIAGNLLEKAMWFDYKVRDRATMFSTFFQVAYPVFDVIPHRLGVTAQA